MVILVMKYLGLVFIGLVVVLVHVLLVVNWWFYEAKMGEEKRRHLPPGDLGLPLIGNMHAFLTAFKSSDPESFIRTLTNRYGNGGMYKALMFGNPSIIVTTPETCKKVLTDDDSFKPGWPVSTVELIGKRSFVSLSYEEHKRLRRLTAASVNGYEALSLYLNYIDKMTISALEKWSKMGEMELLSQLRRLTFRVIMHIFLSSESEAVMEDMEREYTTLNQGVRAMAINFPGFAYYHALKARKRLVAILQSVVDERRYRRKSNIDISLRKKKDMLDSLLDVEDEDGRKLSDEEMIDILLMYLNAGHESSAHIMMWATLYLCANPNILLKAKAEQAEIIKRRQSSTGLTLKEFHEMDYLSKVIDETLRIITFSLAVFREAKADVNINGYTIPKGWKVLVWFRGVHLDPKLYPNPKEFNPSRWDGFTPKAGTFLPFGAGSRLCPGNDLAKLEIAVFLHHFLLNYELERLNPNSSIRYLPHTRPADNCLARIIKIAS